ncbi:hypothetical protein [Paenibacillus hubeiensis]|uniref:hypothetical protein n=1 Tax=Paenibacillus hubeiensis TaxID=3077330 RepID=UPI0031BA2466
MKENLSNSEDVGYLFNVDILIKSRSNALAMQSLLELLNAGEPIADFRIQSGIELGKIIEATIQAKKDSIIARQGKKVQVQTQAQPTAPPEAPASKETGSPTGNSFDAWIETLIKEKRLTRIVVNNKKGKHQSIPCRILNFDRDNDMVSVYHVDEKQVYSFKTNEIDEFL